jgi:GNAT superfamily N-acetyltransferase
MESITVERIPNDPAPVLAALIEESSAQGFNGLRRLVADWSAGSCRFARPGEGLFVAFDAGRVAGVCALDAAPPSAGPGTARLRDMYVSATRRRSGVGTALLQRVVAEARSHFTAMELRAETPGAASFYESHGFRPIGSASESTHRLDLRNTGEPAGS